MEIGTGTGCKNTWSRVRCGLQRSRRKCPIERIWRNCQATCKHCCGDIYAKNKCERMGAGLGSYVCAHRKKVRERCRETCGECQEWYRMKENWKNGIA